MKKTLAALTFSLIAPFASAIDCTGMGSWLNQACAHVSDVAQNGKSDIYVSGYTWHDPSKYTEEKLNALNQWGWGGGYGKHVVDENGNEDLVLGMIFSDSHKNPELMVGYAGLWFTDPVLGGLSLGGGYTVGLTSRRDIFGGIPFPIVLPVAVIRYRQVSVMGTFIPSMGGVNNGNVAFFFSRYEFE